MTCPIYQIDAFTNEPFRGNPAAVCLLEKPADPTWMQSVAAEMNLSETAFVWPQQVNQFQLRWFAPAVEVDLCGHATLAAAHALWESGRLPLNQPARFQTRSGELTCVRKSDWIEMDFPATPPTSATPPDGLIDALGVTPIAVGRSRFDFLFELESEAAVRAVQPDFGRLRNVQTRGVIVTARSNDSAFDFVSRFFCPAVGVNEDPATGSAHCTLAVYWSQLLGRNEFAAKQMSERGGVVRVKLHGDRVALAGQAVTVFRGELLATG
jgi:PhzF family phenazine biosynthesis protein